MQIVIDIPEDVYKRTVFYREFRDLNDCVTTIKALEKAIPLPEHHGRIIDESQIKHIACHTERELYGDKIRYVKATDAPTIIEGSESE